MCAFPQLSKHKSECQCLQCLVVCVIAGYYAYIGFLIMEHTYNNAVVHAFVRLMVDALREKKKRRSHFWGVPLDEDNSDEIEEQLESGKLLFLSYWEMYDCVAILLLLFLSVHTPLLVDSDPGDHEIHAAINRYPAG